MMLSILPVHAIPLMMGILSVVSAHSPDADLNLNLNLSTISFAHGLLGARQVAPIVVPPQCKSTCDPVNSVIVNGCSSSQCCTANFAQSYFDCFLCVGSAIDLTDYSSAQSTIDSFAAQCAARGLDIPRLTFPGQGGSSASASSSSRTSSSRTTSQSQSTPSASSIRSTLSDTSATPSPSISEQPSSVPQPPSSVPQPPSSVPQPPPSFSQPPPPISQQTITALPTTTDPVPIQTTNGSWRGPGVTRLQAVLAALGIVAVSLMA